MPCGDHALLVATGDLRATLRHGLEACGLRVSVIDILPERVALDGAFAAATEDAPPRLVLVALLPETATQSLALADTDDLHWQAACRALIRDTLHCLQATQRHAAPDGTAVVVLGPALTFSGAADLVPLSTAAEAQRGLVKAAARQLGAQGITVNWIGVNSQQLAPALAHARLPQRDERIPVALGKPPSLDADIAAIIDFLSTSAGRKITGASLCLDGGEWMLP